MSRVVIYHAHCMDGFVAAWAAWTRYGDANTEYVARAHGDEPPVVTDKNVLIVDFSYPRHILEAMKEKTASLFILDHHKTAQEALAGLPYAAFDMDRSGAGLTWDTLLGTKRPWLIDYVEDRDLWRWALPHSREINAYLGSVPHSFQRMTELAAQPLESAIEKGSAILGYVDSRIRLACEDVYLGTLVTGREASEVVPIVNTTHATSELLNAVLQEFRGAYAVGWFERADGAIQYSLRSVGEVDVSAIAKLFGGGGHRNAAGFTSPTRVDVRVGGTP